MTVEAIDHVHIEVSDRDAAVRYYCRALGLRPHAPLATWSAFPGGPLILATGAGVPVLSLFEREPERRSRDSTIAFRMSGSAFLDFIDRLPALGLRHRTGRSVTAGDLRDHDVAWSLYFYDPDDNPIEVTTYEYELVKDRVRGADGTR